MLNRYLIPAILVAVVMVAGVFAFMPVEKASTVHGTLGTSAGQTTTNTNTDAEADGQDRTVSFFYNMSHAYPPGNTCAACGTGGANMTIILGTAGETLTGYATLTAIPNRNITSEGASDALKQNMNCGLQTTGQINAKIGLELNATGGSSNFTASFDPLKLVAGEGIEVVLANATGVTGVCAGTIVLTNWGS